MKRWETEPPDPSQKWLAEGEAWLARAEKKGFEPLVDFAVLPDGARVRFDSEYWAKRFLRPEASPYRADRIVKRSVHRATTETVDYLRHDYSVSFEDGELHVIVTETIGDIRIVIERAGKPLLSLPQAARLEAIASMADHVLLRRGQHVAHASIDEEPLAPHEWVFFYASLEEGARFCTDRSQSMHRMWSWAERVDGGIAGGRLYFLGFKRIAPVHGQEVVLPKAHWFDGRAWEMQRAREDARYDILRDR